MQHFDVLEAQEDTNPVNLLSLASVNAESSG